MKTQYKYNGKTVVAVPEVKRCEGCCFYEGIDCDMHTFDKYAFENQAVNGMPNCAAKRIIFKEVKL